MGREHWEETIEGYVNREVGEVRVVRMGQEWVFLSFAVNKLFYLGQCSRDQAFELAELHHKKFAEFMAH